MPVRLEMLLYGPKPPTPFAHSSGLRAIVYGAIQRADTKIASWLHEVNQPKPFTIGPILSHQDQPDYHTVEITATVDDIGAVLLAGLPQAGEAFRLGPDTYISEDLRITRRRTYYELLEQPPEGPSVTVRLHTPTAHHAPGPVRKTIIVPDPRLYLGSWYGRWNLSAEEEIPEDAFEGLAAATVVSAFRGTSRAVQLDRKRLFIGFTGVVQFTVLDDGGPYEEFVRILWQLARFAEFCGTGIETMRGMGRTRLLPRFPTAYGAEEDNPE